MPDNGFAADGSIIRCANCGHSWLESSAIEIIDATPEPDHKPALPAVIDDDDDSYQLEIEALRLTRATLAAERRHNEARQQRRRKLRGWSLLAGSVAAALASLFVFPQHVLQVAPGAGKLYDKAGMEINLRGFEIRNIQQQHLIADGTRVFAIRGEVVNVAGKLERPPALRFILRDATKREVYAWTLDGVKSRELQPNEATNFVTRIASPPESADELQIRFAHAGEIGSNARP